MVADYLNRDPVATFGVGAVTPLVDKLLVATNEAKKWAQRVWKFEHCRAQASVVVTADGGSLTSALRYPSGGSIRIRNIEQPFLVTGQSLVPIGHMTRVRQVEYIRRRIEGTSFASLTNLQELTPAQVHLVQNGNTVFLWPYSASTLGASATVILDIVEFIPDYVANDSVTDFFLEECVDWLKLRTIIQLKDLLKESADDRFFIPEQRLRDAWEAVKTWDTAYVEGTVSADPE